jgi:hypothetical protein
MHQGSIGKLLELGEFILGKVSRVALCYSEQRLAAPGFPDGEKLARKRKYICL